MATSAVVVVSLALFTGACTSASSDDRGSAADDAQTSTETPVDAAPSVESGGGVGPGSPFDVVSAPYRGVDYDGEPAGSALRGDRTDPSFPPPLIEPDEIAAVLPPDGIPAIDEPRFAPITAVDFLEPEEGMVVVELGGEAKAYPIQILVWHEIVNDSVGGTPVSVTYCPLCNSALVFDRRVGKRVLDFGTSGSLHQSALVMYDRQTESLWAHFTGEGVIGHFSGIRLTSIPAQMLSLAEVVEQYPEAQVLTTETGASRPYGTNPYIGYDEESTEPFAAFFDGVVDPRLQPKARVIGLVIDDQPHAVTVADSTVKAVVEVDVGDEPVVIFQQGGLASALDRASTAAGRDVGQTGAFRPVTIDGESLTFEVAGDRIVERETGSNWTVAGLARSGPLEGERLSPVGHLNTFWFAWSAYHPDTTIIGA